MTAPRFFCSFPLSANQSFELPRELTHYAVRVLRLRDGADIVLFDGQGGQYPARLQTDGKLAQAHTGEWQDTEVELKGEITLVQGIATGDKMDWIVEKAVELGAKRLIPIAARRSVLQLSGERLQKRHLHWQRVAQAASEQCGRNRIMQVDLPLALSAYLQKEPAGNTGDGLILFCDPEATQSLGQVLPAKASKLTLLIGPEGGWAPEEQQCAREADALAVQFGQRVLRSETAGLALISAVTALQGWS